MRNAWLRVVHKSIGEPEGPICETGTRGIDVVIPDPGWTTEIPISGRTICTGKLGGSSICISSSISMHCQDESGTTDVRMSAPRNVPLPLVFAVRCVSRPRLPWPNTLVPCATRLCRSARYLTSIADDFTAAPHLIYTQDMGIIERPFAYPSEGVRHARSWIHEEGSRPCLGVLALTHIMYMT